MAEDFYSLEDVVRELKVSEEEVKKMISEGNLKAFREADQLKFRKDEVDKLLQQQFYSFDDVVSELKLTEDDLKRLVSEGELQAYRDADKIKFKKDDVESIKKGRITEPTVILPPDDQIKLADIGKEETFIEEDTSSITEELPFGDTDITIPSLDEEKAAEGDIGSVTTPIPDTDGTMVEETVTDEHATVAEEFAATVAEKPPVLKPHRPPSMLKRRAMAAEMMPAAAVSTRVHPVFIIMLSFAMIVLILTGTFLGDISRLSSGKTNAPVSLSAELSKMVVELFGLKDEKGANLDPKKYTR